MKSVRLGWAAAAVAISSSGWASDPFRPTPAQQIELGQRAAKEMRQKEKVLPDSDIRVQTLRRVGRKVLATIKAKEPWEYSFDVIESPQLNAFALPGGPVFFYTGILAKMQNEDELAGVLSHELTHVRKEHWAYAYRDQMQKSLGLNVLLMVAGASRTAANLANLGLDVLVNLPYGRRQETEADMEGVKLMSAAGYNPEGMARVFEMLARETKGGKPPEFLSTHPSDAARIKRIRDEIAKSGKTYPALRPMTLPAAAPERKS